MGGRYCNRCRMQVEVGMHVPHSISSCAQVWEDRATKLLGLVESMVEDRIYILNVEKTDQIFDEHSEEQQDLIRDIDGQIAHFEHIRAEARQIVEGTK